LKSGAGLEVGKSWDPVMGDSDYAAEFSALAIEPTDFLFRKLTVDTFPELDVDRMKGQQLTVDGQTPSPVLQTKSVAKFTGSAALPNAVEYLKQDASFHMHPSISDATALRHCRADSKCQWIWGTSPLLMGAEVEITGVIGRFNTSVGGTRCHATSQELHVACHLANPALKLTRGEAYLLEGVPTAFPNQPALPVAAMCHYKTATETNDDSIRWDRWCHLISGNEFIVVPSEGFDKIGIDAKDFVAPDLDRPTKMHLALSRTDRQQSAVLASGAHVTVGYIWPGTC